MSNTLNNNLERFRKEQEKFQAYIITDSPPLSVIFPTILQKHNHQYDMPLNSPPTTSETTPATTEQPLMIPRPNTEPNPCIPNIPLQHNVHNPHARVAHNYSLVDDLAQSSTAMYVLEVLQTCSSQ
jgi:hypothetical protein